MANKNLGDPQAEMRAVKWKKKKKTVTKKRSKKKTKRGKY